MRKIIIKTPEQIDGIRKSSRLAAQALRFIEPHVGPGVSTGELDRLLETYIRDHGATPACLGYLDFPKATCISLNEVICHGIPGDRVLVDGDILNIDVTTILDGYYGDTSRMFTVGAVSETAKKLIRVTEECLEIGIAQVRDGKYTGDIGYWISKHAAKNGFSVVERFSGHGTGVEFHELPQITHFGQRYTGDVLREGMTLTIEPMLCVGTKEVQILEDGWTAVTEDGSLTAQAEHTLLVTSKGCEVLTT